MSTVSFSSSSYAAGATATWTVGFTSSGTGTLTAGQHVFVTFVNTGFEIQPDPPVTLASGFTGCTGPTTAATTSQTVNITLGTGCTLADGTPATVTIGDIVNPAAATYPSSDFTVSTSSDGADNSPASAIVITPAASANITFAGSSYVAIATPTTWTVGFTSSASGALIAGNKITVTFPSSFTIPATPIIALGSAFTGAGGATATAVGGVVTITLNGTEALADSTAATLTIAGITNPAAETYPNTDFSVATTEQAASSPATAVVITGTATPLPIQIYGQDPIGTSIAISQTEFPTAGSAAAVVLARDDFFSDALAGGPLAKAVNGPLLLTEGAPESATLDPLTQAEIQRVLPTGDTVYILGGDLALSPNIDTTLENLGYNVVREAGTDEFATAVDIAEQLGNPSTIFEATGLSFYDALSAVPAAIEDHAAILLTDGSTQAPETAGYLAQFPGDVRYAIGGPLAAYGADPTATPVYGQDLFSTSAAVATEFFPNATIYGAATAADFPDALGGGVFMASGGRDGPLLLVNQSAPLPPEITPYLASLAVGTQGYVFGGPLAVGADVLSALEAAVG